MNFFVFLIYSFIYFVGLGGLISVLLDYSPFICFSFQTKEFFNNPFTDWIFLIHEFQWGRWAVDSTHNFIIFLCFILFFPCWILFWFLIRRIRFFKIVKKPFHYFKRKKLERIGYTSDFTLKGNALSERPKAMPKSISFGRTLQENQVSPDQQTEDTQNPPLSLQDEQKQQEPSYTPEIKEIIQQLANEHSLDLFENVLLGDFIVPIILATDTRAFLITFLSSDTEWIADETISEGYDKPTWFSTQGLITSPVYELQTAAQFLTEKEPDSELIKIVTLTKGSILNASLMQNAWSKDKVFVVKLDETIPMEDCLTLADLLNRNVFDSDYMPTTSIPEYPFAPDDEQTAQSESEQTSIAINDEVYESNPTDIATSHENDLLDTNNETNQEEETSDKI